MKVTASDSKHRHKLWGKEQILLDIQSSNLSLKKLCSIYAPSPDKWRGYYSDIWKWRRLDASFDKAIIQYMNKVNPVKGKSPGRPRKDKDDPDWMERFCEALIKNNGNRVKAAEVTPYSFDTITQMLSPLYTSYNEKFTKMVKAKELELAARFEELLVSCADPSNFDSLDSAKITQAKAYISSRALEKLDIERFGRTQRLDVRGTVTHQIGTSQREVLIANLVEEQNRFMKARGLALPAAKSQDVIEAEVIDG